MRLCTPSFLTTFAISLMLAGCATPHQVDVPDQRLTNLAAELGRRGDTTSAIALYERAAIAMPDNPDILISLGHAHLHNGNPQAATRAFQQAYRLREGDAAVLLGLGWAALMEGRTNRASTLIAQAAPLVETASAYNLLGISQLLGGDTSGAIASFQSASQLAPDNLELQINIAMAQALAHHAQEAITQATAVTNSPLAQPHHTRRAVLTLLLAGADDQAMALAKDLPDPERTAILARATQIRTLQSPTAIANAIGMTIAMQQAPLTTERNQPHP